MNKIFSLRFKAVAIILVFAVVLSAIAIAISYNYYSKTMFNHYEELASNVAKSVAVQLDSDELLRYYNEVKKVGVYDDEKYENDEAYRAEYDKKVNALKDESYNKTLNFLFDIKNSFDNQDVGNHYAKIEYLYVQKLEGDYCTYLFDADEEDAYQFGTKHHVSAATMETENPEEGIEPFVSNDGEWLVTAVEPVRDKDGKPVALVGVDISMERIISDRTTYLRNVISIMAAAVAILLVLILLCVDGTIVKPINKLSSAARSFVEDRNKSRKGNSSLSKLRIRSGDEIGTLFDSIQQMEYDINEYITNITTITAEKERIGAELDVAKHIQSSMLPSIFPAFPDIPEFDIYATMDPAKEVGGDFYDFFMVDDTHLAIVVADVSGKGVPAALFMVIGKTLIKDHTMPDVDLSSVFAEVNNMLCESNSEELFITAFEGVLDLVTGEFRYVNAGHEPPFIMRDGNNFELFKIKPCFVLAGMENINYKSGVTTLSPGDKIFQYTDGVTEATDKDNNLFGMQRLEDALNNAKDKSATDILKAVKSDIDEFVGDAPQFDDITMLCLNFRQYLKGDE